MKLPVDGCVWGGACETLRASGTTSSRLPIGLAIRVTRGARARVPEHPGLDHAGLHISEAEAGSDFRSLLARVRAGAEIVIERDAEAVAVIRPAEPHVRLLSESLRLAKEHDSSATLDGDLARDLEEVVKSHREPLNPPAWD